MFWLKWRDLGDKGGCSRRESEKSVLNRDLEEVARPELDDRIPSIAFPVQTETEDVIYEGRNGVLSYLPKVSAEVRRYTGSTE